MKKNLILIGCMAGCLLRVEGSIPEPDNVVYGTITFGGVPVTAVNTNVAVSASLQLNGPAIASYTMGSLPQAGNYYSLRINLESVPPTLNAAAVESNQVVYLSVNDGTGVRAQASFVTGPRGQMTLLNLAGANPGQTTHPADNNPADNAISINEVVAYLLAWRTGAAWPVAPANIPVSYAARAGALWRGGGAYQLDSTAGGAPSWWVNTSGVTPSENPGQDSAATSMPATYSPGMPVTVSTLVTPGSVVGVYGVEDQPPSGWSVQNINNGGVYDVVNGKVKWGLFFDNNPRTLVYQAVPPANAVGTAFFAGQASFDGLVTLNLAGQRAATYIPPIQFVFQNLGLGGSFRLNLSGTPGESLDIQYSTNLIIWQTLSTVTFDSTGAASLVDPISITNEERFYRLQLVTP